MRLAIRHTTKYHFGSPVAHALQRLRLMPKETHGQSIIAWEMAYDGAHEELHYDDQNWNHVTLIAVEPGREEVRVTCSGVVETRDHAGVIGRHTGHLPLWSFLAQTGLTRPGAKMRALISDIRAEAGDPLGLLHGLSTEIRARVAYEPGRTHVATTAEEALAAGHGVCQDNAHIFIGVARALGLPARYISGYLMMDGQVDQEAGHAWAEAHVEGLGWVGFDVANGISPDARYVRVASGRDYAEAAPVTGISFGGAEHALMVELAVEQQVTEQ